MTGLGELLAGRLAEDLEAVAGAAKDLAECFEEALEDTAALNGRWSQAQGRWARAEDAYKKALTPPAGETAVTAEVRARAEVAWLEAGRARSSAEHGLRGEFDGVVAWVERRVSRFNAALIAHTPVEVTQVALDGYAEVGRYEPGVPVRFGDLLDGLEMTAATGEPVPAGELADVVATLVAEGVLPAEAIGMPVAELRLLVEDPAVALALTERRPSGNESGIVGKLAGCLGDRYQVRALFESLPAVDRELLALLFPAQVGSTGGVPFVNRAQANRVNVIAERSRAQAALAELEGQLPRLRAPGAAYELGQVEAEVADLKKRLELYGGIIEDGRQIVLFDPAGDGTVVELHGVIGKDTQNVGVLVPGTTTEMANYDTIAGRSESFVKAAPEGELAMITWMGGDFPDTVARDAPSRSYADELAPALVEFGLELDQEIGHSPAGPNGVRTTVAGHSYGGAVVGTAERLGLDVDRVLHINSAGTGADVKTIADLPASQRDVDRYSLTAPGDFITYVQGAPGGHGADPDTFEGTVPLAAGNYADGATPIAGPLKSHSGVFKERSDAFWNMFEVFTGGTVTTAETIDYSTADRDSDPIVVPSEQVDIE
jgi:hypothetical protein